MASGSIKGITIEFRGDTTSLGKALANVNKEIKSTDSALREVDKALKLDPGNVELLAQKEALLSKQIEQTKEKLSLQKQAAAEAAEALEKGTMSQEEYAKLTAQLAQTEAKLSDLESAASGSADGLSEAGDQASAAGDSAEDAGQAAESAGADWEKFGSVAVAAMEAVVAATAAVATAIGAAAGALVECTLAAGDYADEINTASMVTGLSTDKIQELQYAAELVDTSFETISSSMQKNLKSMSSAADGTGAAAEAYAQLGVSVTDADGNLRDSEEVYWELIDALGNVSDETERDLLAMQLLGKGARELNPLIEAGSDTLADLAEEAHETGYVLDGETLDAFQEFDDQMARMDNGVTAAKNALGTVLLPVLNQMAGQGTDLLSQFTNAVLECNGDVSQLGSVIEEMMPQVLAIIDEMLPILIEVGGTIIETLAQAILDNLDVILDQATDIVLTITEGILDALPDLLPAVIGVVEKIVDFLLDNLPTIFQSAIDIVVTIADAISENLDELIPAVVDCILEIAEVLTEPDNLEKIILAALDIMIALAEGLVDAIPEVVEEIPEIIANIIEAFADLGPQLMDNASEWGADMIEGLISGINSTATSLGNTISGIASEIDAVIGFSVPEKGPLHEWAYNNPGADMMELFMSGMNSEKAALQRSLVSTGDMIYNGLTPDYSSQLTGIADQLGAMGGGTYVINVQVGSQRLAQAVISASQMENYRSGGN